MKPAYIYQVVKNEVILFQTIVYELAENLAIQHNANIYIYRLTKIENEKH